MVVALCAFESGSQENGSGCIYAVDYLVHSILLGMYSGFDVAGGRAVKARGDSLGDSGAR